MYESFLSVFHGLILFNFVIGELDIDRQVQLFVFNQVSLDLMNFVYILENEILHGCKIMSQKQL